MCKRLIGFEPVFDKSSKVLILGSFPSVKSRLVSFYYGNPRNRFWKVVAQIFNEDTPASTEEKISFLLRNRIALWDVVKSCEVDGSSDGSIRNYEVADIKMVTEHSPIELVLLNGAKAYEIYTKHFPDIGIRAERLPSTSPANARFSFSEWEKALSEFR
ncbi:MAG: DNA-deoxyinosine glycosylase [Clostridia bacterium]|nr:DNA-deoxyinosine glycosylase [Clostridia bacterium]